MDAPILLALVCILMFYAAGAQESRMGGNNHGALWAISSALVSATMLMIFDSSWSWLLLSQIALFFGIGAVRAIRK